jgi:hypothetical protein
MSGLRLFNEVYNNENILYESLITEALEIHSADFYYIPRTFVAKDEILGEDRLSKFKNAYPIPMYMETTNGFEGQGAFISKFGLTMEQQATLSVARRSWEAAVVHDFLKKEKLPTTQEVSRGIIVLHTS